MEVTFFLTFCLLFNILHFSSPVISRRLQKSYTSFNLIHSHSIDTSIQTKVYPGDRDILTDLFPSDEYLVFINLTIGIPPVPQLVIFDTGSKLIWISCAPCNNCPTPQLFDQNLSASYKRVLCGDYLCPFSCEDPDDPYPCGFRTNYGSGLNASGIYGTESFTLPTSDGGVEIVTEKLFGCAHKVEYFGTSKFNGMFGFRYERNSFLYNLGSSFSYCIGDLTNTQNSFSQLRIGNGDHGYGIEMLGKWTPLKINEGGNYRVHVDHIVFAHYIFVNKGGDTGFDAIIDTASSTTTLPENFVISLKRYVKEQLNKLGVKEHEGATGKLLCFRGDLMDLKDFPKVMIQCEGEATMELDHRILFKQHTKRAFCFAIQVTQVDSGKIMVIGAVTQQNYHMAYDLDYKRLYMEKVDCQKYKDY
ncbi:aspartic proteinase CDR1-like [Cannabis sativa]|uniref:aspartic proteinase CDR1-like n=1 Tax=Cannabis sativa TaxID=3483 RepID=UPI0029CA2E71|nr:aspartic proteinase CDR1-like [Cannabis sativa]